jgi:integrase
MEDSGRADENARSAHRSARATVRQHLASTPSEHWTSAVRVPCNRRRRPPSQRKHVNGGIRRLGYSSEEMTAHGFRTLASTLLNEQGVHPDLIELQLAHAERNTVRAAYNRAQRLAERREMMQKWADYLDRLRAGQTAPLSANIEPATAARELSDG